jgi:hypothetical protein
MGENDTPESWSGAVEPDAAQPDATPERRPRVRRRVTTAPVPGSDPTPLPEPARHAQGENDEQLKRDKPPHWG